MVVSILCSKRCLALWKRKRTYIIIVIIIALGYFIRPGFYMVSPGTVEELGCLITVEGEKREEDGIMAMVTVSQQQANFWSFWYGLVHPMVDLRSISQVIPDNMTKEEYYDLSRDWMEESQNLAAVIALRKASYEVDIVSDGVEVVDFLPGSPAENILEAGDLIKEVDGQRVYLAEEVVSNIQEQEIGEEVNIIVEREGKRLPLKVKTTGHSELAGKAALEVYVATYNWRPILPVAIEFETGPVIGPSAGMMFVLEILDRLLPENLAAGRSIAGTGTISLDEKVGGIGGVKQKVVAAEKMGIEYFLVPADNYREALEGAHDINVIPVETLDDALYFLRGAGEQ